MARLSKLTRAFGMGLWEFLVGDLPEVFVSTLAIVGLALALHGVRLAAIIVLPLSVAAVLTVSVRFRGLPKSRKHPE